MTGRLRSPSPPPSSSAASASSPSSSRSSSPSPSAFGSRLRLLGLVAVMAALAVSGSRATADEFDPEACRDRCMERVKDKKKCEFICDPKNHPQR